MGLGTKVVVAFLTAVTFLGMVVLATGFFAAGATGVALAKSVTLDSSRVDAIGERIAAYKLPSGYDEDYGVDLLGFSVVGYSPVGHRGHIVLAQFPGWIGIDQDWMEWQCARVTEGRYEYRSPRELRVVGQRDATIRGEKVTLTVSEGISSWNRPYRQVAGVFDGKQGPALIVITSPVGDWDDAEVEAFLASIS